MKKILGLFVVLFSIQNLIASMPTDDEDSDPTADSQQTKNVCDANFDASVDWLYWRARRSDLDLAVFGGAELLSINSGVVMTKSRTVCIDHKYQSGVRIAGKLEWCSGWGLGFDYVNFQPCDRASRRTNRIENVITIARAPGIVKVGLPQAVKGNYDLRLNQVDLVFNYKYGCDASRGLHTFFGTRLAWINDWLRTAYSGINNPSGIETYWYLLDEKTDLNAYGLLVGGEVFQDVCSSLGFYIKAAFSILYGSYDQNSSTAFETNASVANIVGYNINDDYGCFLSTLDLALGLGFQNCKFCRTTWNFIVGYEFHNWLSYRDYLRPLLDDLNTFDVLVRNKSNLGFDGLFVRVGIAF